MNNCGIAVTDRMQTPNRTIVLGLVLAFSAMAVRAQPKAAEATPPIDPAATQQSTPIDLTLHPAAAQQSTPIDLTLHPAAAQQLTPIDLTLPSAAAQQSISTNLAPPPAAAQQATPINPALPQVATKQATPVDLKLHLAAAPKAAPIDLSLQAASAEVKSVARWIVDSGDNAGLPYLVIDKVNATVFAFNPAGQLQGAAAALLGMARGDRMLVPNDTQMSAMPPSVRITPAGRFVSRLTRDSKGKELLVLDYDASLSLHPVVKGKPAERRAERLNSVTSQDNRVSFGCINVPVPFYTSVVSPAFTGTKGIVYVLPETSTASALFGFRPIDAAVSGAQQGSPALKAQSVPTASPPDAR